MASTFDPNQVTFEEGVTRIEAAARKAGLRGRKRILTSKDEAARKAQDLLEVGNVPDAGFRKWQLPVYLDRPSQLFITVAEPNLEVPEHSHDEGDGIRFVAGGSILHNGLELTAGDWMFIPGKAKYSFTVGPLGATMCYCYCCCCAGRMDLINERVDPDPTLGP